MASPAIAVERVSKQYVLGSQQELGEGLRHVLERVVRASFARLGSDAAARREPPEPFWALRDVSFDVAQGEVVGIIGPNGAGKSTLLKIVSRITEPTAGRVRLRGRTASLLEVGTGFHPELTGRENIFLNGAILGMTRAEIKAKFDAIVAFAEVDRFLDTPVKRYSSGMYVRLAFAVAAHLEPEILIVDEVLAVGDAQFQKKCIGKMQDVARQEGRTVLFVSHNMQAVSTLTTRCVLLREGRSVLDGAPHEVIARYLEDGASRERIYSASASSTAATITRIEVTTSEPNSTHIHGRPLRVEFDVTTPVAMRSAAFSFQIMDSLMRPIVHMWVFDSEQPFCRAPGTYRLVCDIPRLRLYLGRYTISALISDGHRGGYLQTVDGKCSFEVVMHGHDRPWPWEEGTCQYLEEGRWRVLARPDDGRLKAARPEPSLSL